jgi:hypothetical protein
VVGLYSTLLGAWGHRVVVSQEKLSRDGTWDEREPVRYAGMCWVTFARMARECECHGEDWVSEEKDDAVDVPRDDKKK